MIRAFATGRAGDGVAQRLDIAGIVARLSDECIEGSIGSKLLIAQPIFCDFGSVTLAACHTLDQPLGVACVVKRLLPSPEDCG